MEKYEVTIQLSLCKVVVEVEVADKATGREIEFAADAKIQNELNYSKLDSYREIKDFS